MADGVAARGSLAEHILGRATEDALELLEDVEAGTPAWRERVDDIVTTIEISLPLPSTRLDAARAVVRGVCERMLVFEHFAYDEGVDPRDATQRAIRLCQTTMSLADLGADDASAHELRRLFARPTDSLLLLADPLHALLGLSARCRALLSDPVAAVVPLRARPIDAIIPPWVASDGRLQRASAASDSLDIRVPFGAETMALSISLRDSIGDTRGLLAIEWEATGRPPEGFILELGDFASNEVRHRERHFERTGRRILVAEDLGSNPSHLPLWLRVYIES